MAYGIPRRTLLRGIGVGGAALAFSALSSSEKSLSAPARFTSPLIFHSPDVTPFRDALPTLPSIRGSRIALSAQTTSHRFHSDLPSSPALAYRLDDADRTAASLIDYLGPTIEAHTDEPLTLRFANRIGVHPLAADMDTSLHGVTESYRTATPTSLHLHGGRTPPQSDGHPEQTITPGFDITHHFPNEQEAAHLWYHDHAMGITRINVFAGLAGMCFLRDRFDTGTIDNPLGLPAEEFEIPLVLQEKIFTPEGKQSVRSTVIVPEGSWEGGAVGDIGLVNGKIWPELAVARGLYRFRTINAASYSVWNLHFENNMRFWVIGNDGGLLDAPVPVTSLRIAPAERYDLLVDFSMFDAGTTVELRNSEAPPFQAAVIGEVAMPLFCRFRVGSSRGFTGWIPTSLRGQRGSPAALPALATPTVMRNVTVSQPYAIRNPPAIMSLNNLMWTSDDIEMPKAGTTEQWNIINVTPDPHPIHIHLVTFRILGRQPLRTTDYQIAHPQPAIGIKWTPSAENFLGGPLQPAAQYESGWKDTVLCNGGTVTRIIVRFPTADELDFDPDATFARPDSASPTAMGAMNHAAMDMTAGDLQGYVWHCHLLDHEDHDMMLRYRILA